MKSSAIKQYYTTTVASQQEHQPTHSNWELVDETEIRDTSSSIVPTVSHVQDEYNSGDDFSLSEDDFFLSDSGDDEDDNDLFGCLQEPPPRITTPSQSLIHEIDFGNYGMYTVVENY